MSSDERFWTRRLRWRLRGATQWPAFVAITVADGVLIDALPPIATADGGGLNVIEGLLIATFGNLVLIGAVAPWVARRIAARRAAVVATAGEQAPSEIERDVLRDRVATALLALGLVGVVVAGLANRPVIVSATEASEAAGRAVQRYVERSGDPELERNLETANIARHGEDFFRVCIARDDRDRRLCLFVDTARDPPRVVEDPSAEPNAPE